MFWSQLIYILTWLHPRCMKLRQDIPSPYILQKLEDVLQGSKYEVTCFAAGGMSGSNVNKKYIAN